MVLRMNRHRQPQSRGFREPLEQSEIIGARELRQARVAHEGFEADDSAIGQLRHFADVSGNQPTPQAEIGDRRRFERCALAVKLARIYGAGGRVERHVEEHRSAACGQSTAAGGGTLPLGAPGFVEMQMDVDHCGEHMQSASIDFFATALKLRADRLNFSVFNREVGAQQSFRTSPTCRL